MTVHLDGFLQSLFVNPVLLIIVLLVNGWTDAPNAIAIIISTRSLSLKKSIALAAIFNFFGVFVMTTINAKVAVTVANTVDFGGDSASSLIALCAGCLVFWNSDK